MYERKILLGFIRAHILHHATRDRDGIYGVGMIKELQRHGYDISPGTLYPILHEMKKNNLLKTKKKTIAGKQRIFYTSTEKGKETLDHLLDFIKELSEEVISHEHS